MTEEQQKKAKDLLLNVLFAQLGGSIRANEDGERTLNDIRAFIFEELGVEIGH